jgi:hypothetical protein
MPFNRSSRLYAASSIAGSEAARTFVIPLFTAIATRRSGSIKRNV